MEEKQYPHIAALLTCHNRRDKTLACLRSLASQRNASGWRLSIHLVDDGSQDGTAQAVREEFGQVHIIPGSGSLYWNGGMRIAYRHAAMQDPDYMLWLNDDVVLDPDAVDRLLAASQATGGSIAAGSIRDPGTGRPTYGGWVRSSRLKPMALARVEPGDQPRPCETFNGNCVLVPRQVYRKVGNLDAGFTHARGDFDYGFRAVRLGCRCVVAPGYLGTCARNSPAGTVFDSSQPLRRRWRWMMSPKGAPPRELLLYTWRHAGILWPLYWLSPYVKLLCGSAWGWVRGGR